MDIAEWVVVHTLGKVNGIQDFQLVAVLQKCVPALDHDTTFRIGYDIGTMALQEVRFQPKSRFTRAGAAHHQHIFVPGILGVRRTVAHHQPFCFGQDDVVGKLGGHERLNILRSAPAGRAVLHAVPVLLSVFATQIDGKP